MEVPGTILDVETKEFQFPASSYADGGFNSTATFYQADLDKVQRKLSGIHVQMYIAGVIGTGLFLGLGQLLATTGPLGVLLVFLLVGSVAFASIVSVTEMAVFAPISGSFSHYAARWVDPALGFATCAITLPAEITAAAVLIGFWDHNSNHVAIYVAVLIVAVYSVNILGARFFGHTEVVFATLKLPSKIIGGLVVNLGGGPDHTRYIFDFYWKHPGPLVSSLEPGALGRFLGLLLGIIYAAFSMCGMEIITLAAAETRNPRNNMVTAMRYCLLPNFRLLIKSGNAGQSPFVLVFNQAGVKVLPHIVNALVLSSAFSSANGMLYSSSRLLFALGVQGQAPKFVTKVTRSGVPYVAILTGVRSTIYPPIGTSNSAVGSLLNWLMIGITYLRFCRHSFKMFPLSLTSSQIMGLKAQGTGQDGVHGVYYRSIFQPYAGMYVVFWSIVFIFVSGLSVFWHFNGPDFVAAYINLPIFALSYVGWKIIKRTKIHPLSQLDFVTGIPSLEETEEKGILERPTGMRKIRQFL
ncbi:general amino acid permease 1 [Lactarius sanguifluus]|nr:general amino acid permease 1 [Lactarius sanguifluus]